jgi:hypothetical protein
MSKVKKDTGHLPIILPWIVVSWIPRYSLIVGFHVLSNSGNAGKVLVYWGMGISLCFSVFVVIHTVTEVLPIFYLFRFLLSPHHTAFVLEPEKTKTTNSIF